MSEHVYLYPRSHEQFKNINICKSLCKSVCAEQLILHSGLQQVEYIILNKILDIIFRGNNKYLIYHINTYHITYLIGDIYAKVRLRDR